MSTTQPQPPAAPEQASSRRRHNPWIWISALLAVAAVGLGIWAYQSQSDLDQANDDVARLQSQVDQSKQSGGTVVAAAKAAFQDLSAQVGATNQGLADAQQQLQTAQADAQKAAQDAAAAVKGSKEEAQAKAQEAQSKATVAANCAKAYISAFGALFDGGSVRAQAATVKQQLQDVSATCKSSLAGS